MAILAVGAGRYGSLWGQSYSVQKAAQPAAGNSKLMKATSTSSLSSLAKAQTQKFISNGRYVTNAIKGKSIISIKA